MGHVTGEIRALGHRKLVDYGFVLDDFATALVAGGGRWSRWW